VADNSKRPPSGWVVRIAENRFPRRLFGDLFEEMATLERQSSGFTVPAIAAQSSCKTKSFRECRSGFLFLDRQQNLWVKMELVSSVDVRFLRHDRANE
jgi:hypothetical protein